MSDLEQRASAYLALTANTIGFEDESAAIIRALLAELSTERKNVKELLSEDCLSDLTRSRMSKILDGVALALKGEPDPLSMHSWHDLAEIAERFASERQGWRSISEAKEGVQYIVGCIEDGEERQAFDWLEDGVWQNHHAGFEHHLGAGHGPGPTEEAPYTHCIELMPLPSPPTGAKS